MEAVNKNLNVRNAEKLSCSVLMAFLHLLKLCP